MDKRVYRNLPQAMRNHAALCAWKEEYIASLLKDGADEIDLLTAALRYAIAGPPAGVTQEQFLAEVSRPLRPAVSAEPTLPGKSGQ